MAEAESAAMILSATQHRLQHRNGVGSVDMTSDEMDSETEEVPSATMLMMRSYQHAAGDVKRNKRKNFQPRNISYSETEPDVLYKGRDTQESSGESCEETAESRDSFSNSDYALDLSNSDTVPTNASKRFRQTLYNVPPMKRYESSSGAFEDRASPRVSASGPVPMDLSCSKNTSGYTPTHRRRDEESSLHSDTESNSEDCESVSNRIEIGSKRDYRGFEAHSGPPEHASHHPYLLHHAFLSQPTDASDLKEYAQNTVKELLEIYGLNSAEVAESITNNVPISNFNSGKCFNTSFLKRSLKLLFSSWKTFDTSRMRYSMRLQITLYITIIK